MGKLLGIGDLTVYSDPKEDPYLDPNEEDEDQEDKEDFHIRFVATFTLPINHKTLISVAGRSRPRLMAQAPASDTATNTVKNN